MLHKILPEIKGMLHGEPESWCFFLEFNHVIDACKAGIDAIIRDLRPAEISMSVRHDEDPNRLGWTGFLILLLDEFQTRISLPGRGVLQVNAKVKEGMILFFHQSSLSIKNR
jgi:hypothetical protein